jgi:hypothetical protein
VSGKHNHDPAEVDDGVLNLHDAKRAAIIANAAPGRASRRWEPLSREKRDSKRRLPRWVYSVSKICD